MKAKVTITKFKGHLKSRVFDTLEEASKVFDSIPHHEKQNEILEKLRNKEQVLEDYTEIDIDLIDESDGQSVKWVDGKLGCTNAVEYL